MTETYVSASHSRMGVELTGVTRMPTTVAGGRRRDPRLVARPVQAVAEPSRPSPHRRGDALALDDSSATRPGGCRG